MENRIGTLLSREALEELDKLWPDHCPSPNDKDMLIKCAQRDVINTIWVKWNAVNNPPPALPD